MNRYEEKDFLGNIFRQLPGESLPKDFRMHMMWKIEAEAARIRKRNERLGLLAVIIASLAIITLAVFAIIYLEIPKITISIPALSSLPFYFYIGGLVLLLLGGDYLMRKRYRQKHKEHI